jgi:hypothetical protein
MRPVKHPGAGLRLANPPESKVHTLVALGEGIPLLDFDVPEVASPKVSEVGVVHCVGKAVSELAVYVLLVREKGIRYEDDTALL